MRAIHLALTAIVLSMTTTTVLSAKRLGPPIEDLQSTPDRVRISVLSAGDNRTPGKILFKVGERLTGDAPDVIELRMDAATHASVEIGESYIVAWTYMRRNRGVIGGWEEDPEGPSVVPIMGVGSVALFRRTDDLEFLFTPGTIDDPNLKGPQVDALLRQTARNDSHARGMAVAELYLRKDLMEQFSPEQATQLKSLFESTAMTPQHQELLIRAALNVPGELTEPWLAEQLRRVVILHGSQYDLSSFVPALVRTAAKGLQQTGNADDIGLLVPLLYSNNPGVAKAALAAMNHFDHEAAVALTEQALTRGWVHSETRRAMTVFLQRGQI